MWNHLLGRGFPPAGAVPADCPSPDPAAVPPPATDAADTPHRTPVIRPPDPDDSTVLPTVTASD